MNKQDYLLVANNKTDFLSGIQWIENSGLKIKNVYSPCQVNLPQTKIFRKKTIIPGTALIFGILGSIGGFYFQYWVNNIAYPLNIGGKPLLPLPSFVPVVFECAVLFASVAAATVFLSKRKSKNHSPIRNLISNNKFVIELVKDENTDKILRVLENEKSFNLKRTDVSE